MQVLQMDHVKLNYGVRTIFSDLNWMLQSQSRIGLVGPNGAGKSSILKLIAGLLDPDNGTIIRARGVEIGYLPQDIEFPPNQTLLETALELPPHLAELESALAAIEEKLGDPAVYNNETKLTRALNQQEKLLGAYEAAGGPQFKSTVREILSHLGFTPDDYDLPSETLSGGQRKLVALSRLAATQPTVLLLDEPDNHLDIVAKRNLERFLNIYQGAVVIVSHDRYLLDEVVTEIVELENGTLTTYKGNYSAYKTARELARLRQQQLYMAQQKEIARIEAAIARFELWASIVVNERHIRQARSRRKLLERMEANGEIIDKVTERRQMDLQLNGGRGSTKAIEAINLSMGFGDNLTFLDLNFTLRHGERVALVGPNGAGKSVLFRLIMGEMQPLEGEIRIGPSTRIGYYSQQHETLAAWWHRTPVELLRDLKPMSDDQAVAFLIKFLFSYEQVRQPIGTMSGGERSRLQLACLMLQGPNLLLLDEPTNNLDIASVEVLEHQLDDFNGAILVISHDRYFLDEVVDHVLELDNGTLTAYPGGYTDYEDQKNKKRQTA